MTAEDVSTEQRRAQDPEQDAPAPGKLVRAGRTVRASARLAAPAIVAYAVARILGLIGLWIAAVDHHQPFWRLLSRFDAGWYVQIASRGYDHAVTVGANGVPVRSNLALVFQAKCAQPARLYRHPPPGGSQYESTWITSSHAKCKPSAIVT